jgi:hypothetical protein
LAAVTVDAFNIIHALENLVKVLANAIYHIAAE